jgi:rubredoxin
MTEYGYHKRWACTVCSYAYDEDLGDVEHGVNAGTPFSDLPEKWRCPWCGAGKDKFVPEDSLYEHWKKEGK